MVTATVLGQALEVLDEQNDDAGDNQLVASLRQPVAVQFPPVFVVLEARPQLVDEGVKSLTSVANSVRKPA